MDNQEIVNFKKIFEGMIDRWSQFNNIRVHGEIYIVDKEGYQQPVLRWWEQVEKKPDGSKRFELRGENPYVAPTMDSKRIAEDHIRNLKPEETKDDGL